MEYWHDLFLPVYKLNRIFLHFYEKKRSFYRVALNCLVLEALNFSEYSVQEKSNSFL